jgi:trimeric autotransporter adhesin
MLLCAGAQFAAEHHGQVKFGGLPVPGATVTATQGDKKLVAVADQQGAYSFADLADGVWKIRVEMLCFADLEQEVSIAADAPSPQWELKLLPMDEIKAAAVAAAASGNSGVTTSIASRPGLPVAQQAAPQPAVQPADAPPPAKPARNAKTNGVAPAQNAQAGFQRADLKASADPSTLGEGEASKENASDSLLFNGSVNNAAVSPFGQSAAFGNARKGMGPRYNFALGATAGNAALDARSFSLTGQATPKPAYNHLQGTATLGGPLVIPHLLPLTRTSPNFNLGYQWVRNRNATTKSSLMPSPAEQRGDLSQSVNALGQPVQFFDPDPNTRAPFPGNVIPQNRISPQAKALLGLYPLPNFSATGRYNHQVAIVGTNNSDALQTRVNKTLNNKNQMFGTFAWQRSYGDNPNVFGFRDTTAGSGINSGVNWTHRFTQRVFSNLRLDYSRSSSRITPYFANARNVSNEAGITGNNQEPLNWGPPTLSFSGGIEALSDGQASFLRNQTAAVGGSVFWGRRSHNIQAGADARRLQFNTIAQQNARGTFGFTGAATGSDFADFLLGIPDTSAIAFGNADKYFRSGMYDAYFTDDWRVRSGFTLNAGVRWEYGSPITELYGRLVNLDIAPGFTAVAPMLGSSPAGTLTGQHYADSLVRPDKHGFQPRIAIAWHPFSASSVVVRAGYGVYYDTSVYLAIANRMAQQSPLSKSLSVQNSDNRLTLANGFIASPSTTTNTFAIDPNFRVGYSQNWQMSVQRDMPGSLVMTATYLGIKGTRAQQQFLPNTFPFGAVNPVGYAYLTSNGNSTRHSGMMQIRRRLHNGFTASAQYTFAKSIDNAALGGRGQGGAAVIAQDWLNLSGERGLSSFDQRHLLNLQVQYTSGIGVRGGTLLSGWRGTAFKGWTVTTNIASGSGLPLTPGYAAAVHGTGVTGSIRPSYTGQDLYATPSGRFLNRVALTDPAAGQWGNAGRNSITGPGQFTLNASMARSFHEGYIDFRIDATNALNHVVFSSWNANFSSPLLFGLPVSVNAMRTVQASLRVRIF